jgi:hypothetical protein
MAAGAATAPDAPPHAQQAAAAMAGPLPTERVAEAQDKAVPWPAAATYEERGRGLPGSKAATPCPPPSDLQQHEPDAQLRAGDPPPAPHAPPAPSAPTVSKRGTVVAPTVATAPTPLFRASSFQPRRPPPPPPTHVQAATARSPSLLPPPHGGPGHAGAAHAPSLTPQGSAPLAPAPADQAVRGSGHGSVGAGAGASVPSIVLAATRHGSSLPGGESGRLTSSSGSNKVLSSSSSGEDRVVDARSSDACIDAGGGGSKARGQRAHSTGGSGLDLGGERPPWLRAGGRGAAEPAGAAGEHCGAAAVCSGWQPGSQRHGWSDGGAPQSALGSGAPSPPGGHPTFAAVRVGSGLGGDGGGGVTEVQLDVSLEEVRMGEGGLPCSVKSLGAGENCDLQDETEQETQRGGKEL